MTPDTLYEDGEVVDDEQPTLSELENKLSRADDPKDVIEKYSLAGVGIEPTRECDMCQKVDVVTKALAVESGCAEVCVYCQGLMDEFDTGVDKPDLFDKRLIGH